MTADQVWPDHLLDLDEWHALPEDSSRRVELADGVLQVSPRAVVRHQSVMGLLLRQLLAVEILSPGTRRLDHVLERHEYAPAGVGWYLLVEPGRRPCSPSSGSSTAPTSRSPGMSSAPTSGLA